MNINVRVFRVDKSNAGYCYECGNKEEILRGITKWEMMGGEKFAALNTAISHANVFPGAKHYYFTVTDMEVDLGEIFETADQYTEWVKKEDKKRQAEARAAAEKRKAGALARKQRQLAKLKAELESNEVAR